MSNPIPKFVKEIWSKWNIRGAILASLLLQIILIFLAPLRKRSSHSILVFFVWSTYLLADSTANFCVGLISNKYGDKDNSISTVNDFLLAFWTPFLLLHLGGPDTITSFSLEDNELWHRHLFGLIVQVCVTAYVFLLTLPDNTLWIPTVLVFLAGTIKYSERTWSLQRASVSSFQESMVLDEDPGPNYAKLMGELNSRHQAGLPAKIEIMPEIDEQQSVDDPGNAEHGAGTQKKGSDDQKSNDADTKKHEMGNPFEGQEDGPRPHPSAKTQKGRDDAMRNEQDGHNKTRNDKEELTDAEVVSKALYYFNKFKGLVVDMIFSFHELNESRTFFRKQTPLDAFRIIEVELNFIYQAFYTKGSVKINPWWIFFRSVSIGSVLAALVLFVRHPKGGFDRFDVKVTYTLLYGAVALDGVSLFMLIFSDHTFALLHSWVVSPKCIDSESEAGKSNFDSILNWFLNHKRPIWIEEEPEPTWFQNRRYKILCRKFFSRRWSDSITGYNLLSYCLDKKTKWRKLKKLADKAMDFIGAKEALDQWKYEKKQPLLQKLWMFIFTELERKSGDADDVETIQRICSSRGEWVIQEGKLERDDLNKLMSYVERNEVTFDQCLILWHIATDLLFYEDEKKENENAPGDGQKQNEDGTDPKKGSDDGQIKNENGTDLEKGISSDGKKKNDNASDIEKGVTDDGHKKNENAGYNDQRSVSVHKNDFEELELRDFSKLLSDYMLYLLIMQPTMMSAVRGIGQIRFQDTCAEARNFFSKRQLVELAEQQKAPKRNRLITIIDRAKELCKKFYECISMKSIKLLNWICYYFCCLGPRYFKGKKRNQTGKSEEQEACKRLTEVCVDYEPSAVKGDRSKSLLFDACKLAKVIKELKEPKKWEIIAQIWVELLSYAAANCIPITHVQQLSKGGEFLSFVWLLMTHLGLSKQFQIKEGHARAKLIVGE